MIELDQMVALSILGVALPGAVITMHQGMNAGAYSSFGGHLLADFQMQGFVKAVSSSNMTVQGATGLAASTWPVYELAPLNMDRISGYNALLITRILVIGGNAYAISVPSNESANLD